MKNSVEINLGGFVRIRNILGQDLFHLAGPFQRKSCWMFLQRSMHLCNGVWLNLNSVSAPSHAMWCACHAFFCSATTVLGPGSSAKACTWSTWDRLRARLPREPSPLASASHGLKPTPCSDPMVCLRMKNCILVCRAGWWTAMLF